MKPFSGQATLRVKEHEAVVFLSLDMEKGELEAELPASALPNDAVRIRDGEPDEVIVTDVRIPLPTGTLYAERIPDVLMGSGSTANSSTGTSPISTALNLVGDRSGTRRFTLSPKSRFIEFRHDPPMTDRSELYYLNNFIDGIPMDFTSQGLDLLFQPRKQRSLSITANTDLRPYAERLATCWSILQGAEVNHTASFVGHTLQLSVRRPRPYNRGHSLFRGLQNAQALLEALTNYFLPMDADVYEGWRKVVRFYLEGVNSDLDYDVRIVNYMVVIEMLDRSPTMTKQSIATTFGTSLEFADLLVRMRNRMIHERMSLWNAVPLVHAELLLFQKDWRCDEIPLKTNQYTNGSILFVLHVERMVNTYIIKECGYAGDYNDCMRLIKSIEKKIV
jgi:hypothetical protein